MKYKLVSGLKLQYGYTQTPNGICRKLLKGQEVKLKKEVEDKDNGNRI